VRHLRRLGSRIAGDRIVVLAMLFVSIAFVIVLVADVRMAILDAIRGYVHGEGMWSKGQKAAVVHLIRYAQTNDDWSIASPRSTRA
jgi:hypothetical protein